MTIDQQPRPSTPPGERPARTHAALRDNHGRPRRAGARKQQANRWMRWTHVYVSMFALLAILFFGLTGLTLNHPDWAFGGEARQDNFEGTLPDSVVVDGQLELLLVSEYLRSEYGVGGDVSSFDTSPDVGTLSYRGPGYGADAQFDVATLDYTLTVQQQGFVAVLNDIHRGSDTGSAWKWAIDVSAGFLVVVAVTGLTIQFLMRKRRTRALIVAGFGSVVLVTFVWIATA